MDSKPTRTVHTVIEAVRRQIRSGGYASGNPLPAEMILAADLGVSRGTVRRAIELMVKSGELRRRRHSRPVVAKAVGHAPEVTGHNIGVWVSRPIADGPSLLFLKGISKGLAGTPFRMLVREPSRFVGAVVMADERHFLLDLLDNPEVPGAIMERDSYAENTDVIERLVAAGKYLVFVDAPPPAGVAADHVGTANVSAARTCVEYLLEQGHSRIACVVDSDVPQTTRDRIKGYWRAMRQAGVDGLGTCIVAANVAPLENPDLAMAGPYARVIKKDAYFADLAGRCVDALLKLDPRPTAVFVGYDVLAYWICALLGGAGVRVPEDMSVVGFDWFAHWEKNIPDTLTTASQDFEGFGRHAADLLLDRIAGEVPAGPRNVLLNAPLVIRSSTTSDLLLPVSSPAKETTGKVAH